MGQITVEQLFLACAQEIERGNGKKNIVISDDNEGNAFHGLFCGFSPLTDPDRNLAVENIYDSQTCSPQDTIILG